VISTQVALPQELGHCGRCDLHECVWQLCCRLYANRSAQLHLRCWLLWCSSSSSSSSKEQAVGAAVQQLLSHGDCRSACFWQLLAGVCCGKHVLRQVVMHMCKAFGKVRAEVL
jgi:hypothetical protein